MTERGRKRGEGRGSYGGDCLWAGGWIAAGKNGRKCSGCQLSPKPLGDKDETEKKVVSCTSSGQATTLQN